MENRLGITLVTQNPSEKLSLFRHMAGCGYRAPSYSLGNNNKNLRTMLCLFSTMYDFVILMVHGMGCVPCDWSMAVCVFLLNSNYSFSKRGHALRKAQ